ncbi:MAG: permease, partial [Acidobacteria bacterium]
MGTLLQDVRYGARMLAKNPGFTAVAVLTLALGIGANTAIFTLIDGLLLRSLPVQEPDELVLLGHGLDQGVVGEAQRGSWELFSYAFYQHLHEHNRVFQDVCAFQSFEVGLSVRFGDTTSSAPGKLVSGNYFSVLGVRPLLGRLLTPEDDTAGATPAAVISYRFWSKQPSQDSTVLGKTVDVNGTAFTVIGVTPPGFFGETLQTDPPDMWLPLTTQPQVSQQESLLTPQGPYWLGIIGRLKPEATFKQAQANVSALLRAFLDERVRSQVSVERWREIQNAFIVLTPGGKGLSELRESFTKPLYILFAGVGLVLLIACANVANLLMARATARQREVSVRHALGASRSRLVRQFLTESILLALCGGAAGLLFASWGTTALVARVANGADYVPLSVSPDSRVLGFTLCVCILTGILFGLAPALGVIRGNVTLTLKENVRTAFGGGGRWSLSSLLVVSQVAVSLFLLIGAGLLVRALRALENQDWGFAHEKVLVVNIDPKRAGYRPEQLPALYRQLLDRVNALPGVHSASLALYSWLSDIEMIRRITVPGYTPQPDERTSVQVNLAGPRYFETEGMTLLLGREFGAQDTEGAPHVAVVNEALVRRFYFGHNPIGKTLHFQTLFNGGDIEVVGV